MNAIVTIIVYAYISTAILLHDFLIDVHFDKGKLCNNIASQRTNLKSLRAAIKDQTDAPIL
jgi:hypothetical protein